MKHQMINMGSQQRFMKALNPQMITEVKNILYYNTGIYGGEDNAMPQYLIQLLQASSIHANLCQTKFTEIQGNNLDIIDDSNPLSMELAAFIRKRNLSGDNLKSVYSKCARDFSIQEAATIQVLYDYEGKIASIYHVPVENVRMEKPNNYNQIENYYVSNSWADISNSRYKKKTANNSAIKVPAFNPQNWKAAPVQILYISKYSPSTYYSVPNYVSSIEWILIDNLIARFEIQNLKSNYWASGMLVQQGNPTPEEMDAFIQDFQSLYRGIGEGDNGQEKMIFSWIDDMATQKPELIKFVTDTPDFEKLLNKCEQKIIYAHNAYPEVAGKSEKTADLGGQGNALYVGLQAFNQLVCTNMRDTLVDGFNKVLEVNGYDNLLTVETESIKTTQPTANVEDLSLEERRYLVYGLETEKNNNTPTSDIVEETPEV
jgi:hypothetical protein